MCQGRWNLNRLADESVGQSKTSVASLLRTYLVLVHLPQYEQTQYYARVGKYSCMVGGAGRLSMSID